MSDSNVYYSPESFGLTVLDEAEAGTSYEFDTFVVWLNTKGDYLWASDCGCSCPCPFEDVAFAELPVGSARDALTDLKAWIGERDWSSNDRAAAARDLLRKLEASA